MKNDLSHLVTLCWICTCLSIYHYSFFFGQSLTQVASAQSPKSKSVPKISTLTKGTTWGCIAEQQEYPPRSSPGWKTGDKSFQRWDTTFCLSPLMLPLTQINNCIYICCAVSILCTSRCAVCRWYFIILCQFVWLFQRFNHLPLCSLCLSLPLFLFWSPPCSDVYSGHSLSWFPSV